ncbi:MAG: hypothetical protein A2Y62_18090 [Candidatus Fischerbacteria bacterium RBG_13_37_8]|uniref:RNase H type-1 domain-containing protein n=1 Tax=Candidatus Fischerbacteria bacterium RBG_13_37_8 TaxID=1817863 RepID=A0A1F5VVN7_9BACT|nr:MAG: hypothetical protein A2Y62_18090 [Candidatus Fischerbacteria bacterium RBG_13_37_8]
MEIRKLSENHETLDMVKVYTDGGSRGNPGPAAIGILFVHKDEIIMKYSEYLGTKTNNQAEYTAVIRALELCQQFSCARVEFFSDSLLVIQQLKGLYKIRNRQLQCLYFEVRAREKHIKSLAYHHVLRGNPFIIKADRLVNEKLDEIAEKETIL